MSRRVSILIVASVVLVLAGVAAMALRESDDPEPAASSAGADAPQTAGIPASEQSPVRAGDGAAPTEVASSSEVAPPTAPPSSSPAESGAEMPAPQAPTSPAAAVDPNQPVSDPATRAEQEPVDVSPLAPVAVAHPADFGNGIVASVAAVEGVDVEATRPGETAGPAAAVRVTVENSSGVPVNLDGLVVNASDESGTPLVPNFTSHAHPLSGVLAPGQSREGTYVFRTDGGLDGLTIDIHHDTTANFVVITT